MCYYLKNKGSVGQQKKLIPGRGSLVKLNFGRMGHVRKSKIWGEKFSRGYYSPPSCGYDTHPTLTNYVEALFNHIIEFQVVGAPEIIQQYINSGVETPYKEL